MSGILKILIMVLLATSLSACGNRGLFKNRGTSGEDFDPRSKREQTEFAKTGKIQDLFKNRDDPNVTVAVNKYIWNATLDILSFMPVEAADPFSGVIVMGWGSAAGSSRQYRATVYIQDPALDARSLRVALMTRGGPASKDTIRQIEDAILTRARQMRIADGKL